MNIDKNRNIILIGYMGSGKSTVGYKAAKAMEYSFLDTDCLIENEEEMTISKLFEEKGEAYFRKKETETIRKLLEKPKGMIIATGGGLPMKEENAALLKELGTVIYLKAETDTLFHRLSGDNARPLLKNGDLREKIETMLAIRGPVYEACADVVLQTDHMSFYEIICQIEKLLKA
ncbi:MAG: shikimate kinase [Lachnospiraceae bacterium]|nr:shikimate kinase [Lachnospiraceae bacterium]